MSTLHDETERQGDREITPADRHKNSAQDIEFFRDAIETAKLSDNVGQAMQLTTHCSKLVKEQREQDKLDRLLIPVDDVRSLGEDLLRSFNSSIDDHCTHEQATAIRRDISKELAEEFEPFI